MNRAAFQEALLAILERKAHRSDAALARGAIPRERFHIHLEQEWEVFVRDFPVFLGRAYVQCPLAPVRRALAENLYEEETGGLSAGRPHPELFLELPRGLGFDLGRFERVTLLPGSRVYRETLDRWTLGEGWEPAAAVATLWVEGTRFERGELDPTAPRRPMPPLEEHPLRVHYNIPLEALSLPRAHRAVEGGHRQAAWTMMLDHVPEARHGRVLEALEDCLRGWTAYRDAVAEACGVA